jgi:hypothetical protein
MQQHCCMTENGLARFEMPDRKVIGSGEGQQNVVSTLIRRVPSIGAKAASFKANCQIPKAVEHAASSKIDEKTHNQCCNRMILLGF